MRDEMRTAVAIREYWGSIALCLLVTVDFIRRSLQNSRRPTPKEIKRMALIAALVAPVLFVGRYLILLLGFYLVPMVAQKFVLAVGFLLGLQHTAEARRTKRVERWLFAALAWVSFLVMADYCLRTGSLSYSVD